MQNPGIQSPQPQKTVSHVLGEITWLLSQSPLHKQLFISDLEWFVMPPLMLEQFRIFYGPSTPAAVAMWAFVSDEIEQRLMDGASRLRPDEWKSGDHLWLMELVAPFGAQDEILSDLSRNVFPNRSFNYHRIGVGGAREVATYEPSPAVN